MLSIAPAGTPESSKPRGPAQPGGAGGVGAAAAHRARGIARSARAAFLHNSRVERRVACGRRGVRPRARATQKEQEGARPIGNPLHPLHLRRRRAGTAAAAALAGALLLVTRAAPSAGESADTAVELTLPLSAVWHVAAGELTLSSWRAPLRDMVLILPAADGVEARAARTGEVLWRASLGSLSPRAAAYRGDLVLVGGVAPAGEPDLIALDAASGGRRFAVRLGGVFAAPIATPGGFVTASTHALAAFDAAGARLWQVDFPRTAAGYPGGPGLARPALLGELVLAGAADSRLHAFALADGHEVWSAPLPRRLLSGVAADGAQAIVSTLDTIIAFDPLGHERWRRAIAGDPAYATPAVADGVVYAATGTGGAVLALDAAGGRLLWTAELGADCYSQPAITRDHVIAGDTAGRLLAIERAGGATAWSAELSGGGGVYLADPVVADSLVGVGTADGTFEVLKSDPAPVPPAAGALRFAPNPFRDEVTILVPESEPEGAAELLVFDASGRLRRRIAVAAGTRPRWDGRDRAGRALPAGTYFLRLNNERGARSGKVERLR